MEYGRATTHRVRVLRGDQAGQAPERDRGFGWLRPPLTNFLDSGTRELTRLLRLAPLLRRQLLVHDPGRGKAQFTREQEG